MAHTFTVGPPQEVSSWWLKNHTPQHFLEHPEVSQDLKGETLYAPDIQTVGGESPFFDSVAYAFNMHMPLVIKPDAAWLTILTGLTHHIDTDPEGLRHHFVEHEGQVELVVEVGSPPIPHVPPEVWTILVQGFSEQIGGFIGKKKDLIVCDFSTTTDTDRLSSEIALMGAMKHYFTYKAMLLCGLTDVTIEGTPDDWGNMYDRVRTLSELGLGWWTDHLLPVIDQFRLASEGKPDIEFWKAAYRKERFGSGSQGNVSGWINVFHPYIAGERAMRRNVCVDWQGGMGIDQDDFPSGLVMAPVLIDDHGVIKYNTQFYGGLMGVSLGADQSVQAVSGWFVQNLGPVED